VHAEGPLPHTIQCCHPHQVGTARLQLRKCSGGLWPLVYDDPLGTQDRFGMIGLCLELDLLHKQTNL
jgi:hypothetical protein